ALGRDAQLFEDVTRRREGKIFLLAEPMRELHQDLRIGAGIAWRIDRFVDLHHSPFAGAHHAVLLFLQAPGEYDIGMLGGLRKKKVDGAEKLQLFERIPDVPGIRQRDQRVETNREQSFDLSTVNRFHDLDRRIARVGQTVWIDAPYFADVSAGLRIFDVPLARQLVALLPVLAAALSIALARDHIRTGAFSTDLTGCQAQVDDREDILHTVGMVLDAASM